MKLFRICSQKELEKVLSGDRMVPLYKHSGAHSTLAHNGRAFWFFETIETAVNLFGIIATCEDAPKEESCIICEYDIPKYAIAGRGFSGYGGFFCSRSEWNVPEVITRELRGAWLTGVHYVNQIEVYDKYFEDYVFKYELI